MSAELRATPLAGEGMRLIKSSAHKARKLHWCCACGGYVKPGERYTLQTVADPRRFASVAPIWGWRVCGACLPVEVAP
jgi:hypothetical protein